MHSVSTVHAQSVFALPSRNSDVEPGAAHWVDLVTRIKRGDKCAAEQLYEQLRHSVRYKALRQIGREKAQDVVQETMVKLLAAIRDNVLREPASVAAWVHTVAQRLIIQMIHEATSQREQSIDVERLVLHDRRNSPERAVLVREQAEQRVTIMNETLKSLPPREREILTRFYLYAQTQEQICAEMGLTDTQFRLVKSRAKQRFEEKGKRLLSNKIRPIRRAVCA